MTRTRIPTTTMPTTIPRFLLKILTFALLEDFFDVGRQDGCEVDDEFRNVAGLVVARPVGRMVNS